MSKLQFTLQGASWYMRAWEFTLNGITVQTPVFMPVGTKGTVKGVPLGLLQDPHYMGPGIPNNIILNNTLHLYLRPWDQIVKNHGWLHHFIHRDKLILTDSGGFQIFSLGLSKTKTGKPLVKIHPDHVVFTSPYDGSKHTFTPTGTVDIQSNLGSDIMMMLDVCAPVNDISKKKVEHYMHQTHRWAKEQFEYMQSKYDQVRWVLFPIVQGGLYTDLREESIRVLSEYATDGIAIGWLSVGETLEEMEEILAHIAPLLPKDKPRYLMGVGTPESLLLGIKYGIDMFDCVAPTRLGRHGVAYCLGGNLKLTHAKFKHDQEKWLAPWCQCHTCRTYTRWYLYHLFNEWEALGGTALSIHNLSYLQLLCQQERNKIIWI